MLLGLIVWPVVALLGVIGLHALAPHLAPERPLLPAVRTVALITTAAAYVAAVWSH
jgi:hypothetical protein